MDRSSSTATVLALAILAAFTAPTDLFAQDGSGLAPGATTGGPRPLILPGFADPLLAQVYQLEIPALIDRPLGLEEGPRIRVIEFNIEGAVDRPERGVTIASIDRLLLDKLVIQPLEGFTINELQAIADEITAYYRGNRLILAQAVVPAQNVQDGIVTIRVLEGVLNSVAVEGNEIYSADRISSPFNDLLNQAVDQNDVEEAILSLQDLPGLTVFGTFRQGSALGQTELLVSVRDEDRFYIRPSIDNYGSELTGDVRTTLEWGVNNVVGAADRLSGYLVRTASPDEGSYYGLEYRLASRNTRNRVGFGVLKNRFDATPAATNLSFLIEGEVKQANVFYERQFANRRAFRADGALELAVKDATTTLPISEQRDELKTLGYTFNYYAVGRGTRGINVGYFRAMGGQNDSAIPTRQGGSGALAGDYTKFEFNYQRLQRFADHHSLLLRLEAQKTDDLLVSLEQYSIGGPANMRAYPVAEALFDTGAAASLEWIIEAPGFADRSIGDRTWGDVFQLSVFRDYAGGELNDPRLSQPSAWTNYRGYGIGLLFSATNKFYLRLDAAKPDSNITPSNNEDPQYYIGFNYTF
jgi:hemolysin activation/secretion protein